MSDSAVLWYLNRATGIVCLVLFSAVMLLGIAVRTRTRLPGLPRFATSDLHRNLSLLSVAFLCAHIGTAVVDGYVSIGWVDALVPFTSGYQPLWTGLGTLGLDLLLAVLVTSLLRARLGHRVWRAVHWAAYASWTVAVAHGVGIGTDSATAWVLWLTVGCAALVLAAIGVRVVSDARRSRRERPAWVLATALTDRHPQRRLTS